MEAEEHRNILQSLKRLIIGKARNLQDPGVFNRISLIAFFAWVGLGADGLSSSCYGPSEAFLALKEHSYLGIFVGLGTVITIFIISACYSQIIELFPTGGGGYLVASKLLSPTFGMISGCALLIDYVMTIALSIASGTDAIFSFLPASLYGLRLEFAIFGVIIITILNLRGVKESVIALMPIFLIFVATHLFAVIYASIIHFDNFPVIVNGAVNNINTLGSQVGIIGVFLIILRAYSMGAGTYTGIETVSNGLPILRDPKVQTGKRTMRYMAVSLSVMVLGLIIAYMLFDVKFVFGKTLNAVLFESLTANWSTGASRLFVWIVLLSEGAILFVAAQSGFIGGPRVLSNMALDRWFATRFANLNDRLVTQNGVLLMGGAAVALMAATHGSVQTLLVLYSINVFITFVLSQAGMVRHWWQVRQSKRQWKKGLLINGIGLILTAFILTSVIAVKFYEGGWVTLLITGSLVLIMFGIRRHYQKTFALLRRLDDLVPAADASISENAPVSGEQSPIEPKYDPKGMTAVLLVNGYNGLGLHSLFSIIRLFRGAFKNFVFIQVGVVDAGAFKGTHEVENLERHVNDELSRYLDFVKRHGYYGESASSVGTDIIGEIEKIGLPLLEKYPQAIFFGGQIVFPDETLMTRWLHNHVVFAVQSRFYHKGMPFMILPIRA